MKFFHRIQKIILIAVIVCITFLTPATAWGYTLHKSGNTYYAGVDNNYFAYHAARYQKQNFWCWAASIQMVLNYYKIPATQEQIVQHVKKKIINTPANNRQIIKGLTGWQLPDSNGRIIYLYGSSFDLKNNNKVIKHLGKYSSPIIVGLKPPKTRLGHAYVLIGVDFMVNNGIQNINIAYLYDPTPRKKSLVAMSWIELKNRLASATVVHTNRH